MAAFQRATQIGTPLVFVQNIKLEKLEQNKKLIL
jgi:hypothetical protein